MCLASRNILIMLFCTAHASRVNIDKKQTTDEKVSSLSTPYFWVYPLATNRALNRSTLPSLACLTLNTHIQLHLGLWVTP